MKPEKQGPLPNFMCTLKDTEAEEAILDNLEEARPTHVQQTEMQQIAHPASVPSPIALSIPTYLVTALWSPNGWLWELRNP